MGWPRCLFAYDVQVYLLFLGEKDAMIELLDNHVIYASLFVQKQHNSNLIVHHII